MIKILGRETMLTDDYEDFIEELKKQSMISILGNTTVCDCVKTLVGEDMIVITDKLGDSNELGAYLTRHRFNTGSYYNYHGNESPTYVYDYYPITACPICGARIELEKNPTLKK